MPPVPLAPPSNRCKSTANEGKCTAKVSESTANEGKCMAEVSKWMWGVGNVNENPYLCINI